MRVTAPTPCDGGVEVQVAASGDGPEPATIRFRGASLAAPPVADASVALGLLPAMRRGEPLEIAGPVDAGLRDRADQVQRILTTWDRALRPTDRWYRRVDIVADDLVATDGRGVADGLATAKPTRRTTAAFFTGGVDSFHTAITHRDDIDALVYVHGFDVALDDHRRREEVTQHLQRAAADLGLPLLEIETDLRTFGERHGVGWPDYHGAALATVAHLLTHRFERMLVPATHTYAHLEGLGSHPLLDPLWSSASMEIAHVGADSTRVDKLRAMRAAPAARQHLRVCWANRDGTYNCGRCEKCIRTGAAVRIAGLEGDFPTIPKPSLRDVATVRVTGRGSPWSELRDELAATGANPRLQRAIEVAIARHQLARWSWTRRWFG